MSDSDSIASRVPDGFAFQIPWHKEDQPLHEELRRELSGRHQLYGVTARAVARRQDNDDVLFELFGSNAPAEFAMVHLTGSSRPDQFSRVLTNAATNALPYIEGQ
jgi:hypothetical protein